MILFLSKEMSLSLSISLNKMKHLKTASLPPLFLYKRLKAKEEMLKRNCNES